MACLSLMRAAARSSRAFSKSRWLMTCWAIAQHVISQRDFEKARDDLAAARINDRHAIDSAKLEDESLALDLKVRRLDRDRQKLVYEELARRVADQIGR